MSISARPIVQLDDRARLERWLRRAPSIHLYELGDLDDFFFPHTTWFAFRGPDERSDDFLALALLYSASDLPVLVLLGDDNVDARKTERTFLEALSPSLPKRFYAHLMPHVAREVFEHAAEPHGLHDRMVLTDIDKLRAIDTTTAVRLGPSNAEELHALYARSYEGNWFDPRMLTTSAYWGVREAGKLVSVAGVHVVSRAYGVAALGNVTCDPDYRGRGLAKIATAAASKALLDQGIDPLGLNVESANAAAIHLYAKLGFTRVMQYEESMIDRAL